jgi:hypothetical protein
MTNNTFKTTITPEFSTPLTPLTRKDFTPDTKLPLIHLLESSYEL